MDEITAAVILFFVVAILIGAPLGALIGYLFGVRSGRRKEREENLLLPRTRRGVPCVPSR
jgi:membrane protein DedA with SNARE-associated domain